MAQQQKNFWDTPAGTFFKWTTPVGMIGSAISGIGDFFGGGGSSQKNQAYDDLMKFQQTKPGDYSSQYADEINSLMDQLNNRKFEYDYTQDPAYQYYQSLYKQQAQRPENTHKPRRRRWGADTATAGPPRRGPAFMTLRWTM